MAKKKYESRFCRPAIRPLIEHYGIGGVHPECEAVDEISPRDFDLLVESISRRGLLRPILIDDDGMLIDGRSRLSACHLLGIEIPDDQIEITDKSLGSIIERNTAARNLTKSQYAMKSVQVLAEERDEAKQRRRDGGEKGRANRAKLFELNALPGNSHRRRHPKALEIAAKKTGVARSDLVAAEQLTKLAPEIAADVNSGVCSLDEGCRNAGVRKRAKRRSMKKRTASFGSYTKGPIVFWAVDSLIRDEPTGVREVQCGEVMVFSHPQVSFQVVAYPRRTKWVVRATDGSKFLRVPSRESARTISSLWIQNGRDAASQLLKQKSFWRQEKERCDKQKKPLICIS